MFACSILYDEIIRIFMHVTMHVTMRVVMHVTIKIMVIRIRRGRIIFIITANCNTEF